VAVNQRLGARAISGIDIPEFISVADDQGIAPLFYPLLADDDPLPGAAIAALRSRYEQALVLRDFRRAELIELRARLGQDGRAVLLQGMALDERIYSETLARPMSDIDLLLPDGTIAAARGALAAGGFEPLGNYRNVWRGHGLQIDLHADLWGADRVPARRFFAPVNDHLYQPSRTIPGYLLPADEVLALHSVYHAMKHGFSRRIWDCDMLLLWRSGALAAAAAIDRCGIVCLALQRLARLGLIDAADLSSRVPAPTMRRRLFSRLLPRANRTGSGETLLALACRKWSQTAWYLWSTMIPPAPTLREMYGRHAGPALVARRLWALSRATLRGRL
jgi:hypothetical protein